MEKVDNLNILFYVNSYAFLWGWKFLLMSTMTTYFHNFSRTNEITFHKFMVQISPFPKFTYWTYGKLELFTYVIWVSVILVWGAR